MSIETDNKKIKPPISIIVHGGAGKIPDKAVENYKIGAHTAAEVGYTILENGGAMWEGHLHRHACRDWSYCVAQSLPGISCWRLSM